LRNSVKSPLRSMVELIEGRLGGGKTYLAVVRALDQWLRGGIVCSNVDFLWDAIKEHVAKKYDRVLDDRQLITLQDEQVGLFHKFTPSGVQGGPPVLVIIDEAHLTFNARDWSKTHKDYRETLTFLTQSRKVHTDVILISQSVLNMDKQFMRLVQYIWRCRDLSKWRVPGLGVAYPFQTLLVVQYDYDGTTVLRKSFEKKRVEIFNLYKTNSLLRTFPRLEGHETAFKLEKAKEKKALSPMMKLLIPICIFAIALLAWKVFNNSKETGKPGPLAESTVGKLPGASPKPSALQPQSGKQLNSDEQSIVNDGLYDIYAERFVAWSQADRSLQTERGWYALGEMSGRGYVTAISDRRAKLAQPNGRTAWVVANRDRPRVAPSPTPRPADTGAVSVVVDKSTVSGVSGVPGLLPSPVPILIHGEEGGEMTDAERNLRDWKAGRRPRPANSPRPLGN